MEQESMEKLGRLVGLARRSGDVTLGLRATIRALHDRRLGVVFLARDASDRTSGILRRESAGTFIVMVESMTQLGALASTAPVAGIGIRHGHLAREIKKLAGGTGGS